MTLYVQNWDGQLLRLVDRPAKATEPAPTVKVSQPAVVSPTGKVVARIAQLNVVDTDGDVTVTGAVGAGQDVLCGQWNHAVWSPGFLPVGKGRVTEEGSWLIFRGQLFDTGSTWKALRAMGNLCEWSYGYTIPPGGSDRGSFGGQSVRFLRKLNISEVSPVLKGAGVGTGTVELSGVDPRQIMLANAARDNELALATLTGYSRPAKSIIGWHDGLPIRVRAGEGGRK